MSMTKKIIPFIILILLLSAVLVGIWIYSRISKNHAHVYPGYAEGELVYVSSPVSGAIRNLTVSRGDQAEAGKLLFELEREQERASKDQATEMLNDTKVRLDHANNDFVRQIYGIFAFLQV